MRAHINNTHLYARPLADESKSFFFNTRLCRQTIKQCFFYPDKTFKISEKKFVSIKNFLKPIGVHGQSKQLLTKCKIVYVIGYQTTIITAYPCH